MYLGRKQDLSVIYWLKGKFENTGVEIVDGFPEEILTIPVIAVEWDKIDTYEYQMGSKDRLQAKSWFLDVYAKTTTQRDEIIHKLLEEIEQQIEVYNYDEGFPPDVSPTQIGVLRIMTLKAKNIQVLPRLKDERLHYRAVINFMTECEMIGGI